MKPLKAFVCISLFICTGYSLAQTSTNADQYMEKIDTLLKAKHYKKYKKTIEQFREFSKQRNDTESELKTYRYLCDFFNIYEKNDDSLTHYLSEGNRLAQLYNNQKYLINFKYIKARYLTDKGNYSEAYKIFNEIEEQAVKNDYDFLPNYYSSFAKLHYRLKEIDLAFIKLKKAGKLFKKQADLKNTSGNYNNLGILYKVQKQFDSSLVYHNKSLKISKQLNDTLSIAYSYNNIGSVYYLKKDYEQAENYFTKALAINPQKPSPSLLNNYSKLLIESGNELKAETFLFNAITTTTEPQIKIEALNTLIDLKKKQENFKDALELSRLLNSEKEVLLNAKKISEIERLKAEFDSEKKETEITLLKEQTKSKDALINKNKIIGFIILLVVILVFIIIGLVWHNRFVNEKANRLLLEQQLLRSQMNPHFIFNALSNIQSTILKNENEKAVSYLAKFSKLVRSILENSKHTRIIFANEIKAIKGYLELQKIRFSSFNYSINIDENIEDELTYIPTMLFQPIIENAIEHGIESIENGKIDINFKLQNNIICCSIIDNGVGISNTKHKTSEIKQSMSTRIIKERLALFSKKMKVDLSLITSDLIINNKIEGTKAVIDIPIINEIT